MTREATTFDATEYTITAISADSLQDKNISLPAGATLVQATLRKNHTSAFYVGIQFKDTNICKNTLRKLSSTAPSSYQADTNVFIILLSQSTTQENFAVDVANTAFQQLVAAATEATLAEATQKSDQSAVTTAMARFRGIFANTAKSTLEKELDTLEKLHTHIATVTGDDGKYAKAVELKNNPRHKAKRAILLAAETCLTCLLGNGSVDEKTAAIEAFNNVKQHHEHCEYNRGGFMATGDNETKTLIDKIMFQLVNTWLAEHPRDNTARAQNT